MRSKKVLIAVQLLLVTTAIAVPVFLKQIPLPVRLIVSFTDLVAATAIALYLRQKS